jgi:magnesium transporter
VQVLQYADGAWRRSSGLGPEAARDLAFGPTHVWIRLEGLAHDKLDTLGAVFNLHPLAIEDVRNTRQRPKVEDYADLTFVIAKAPRWNTETLEMSWLNVGLFLGPDFLITACTEPVSELDLVEKRLLEARASPKNATVDRVLYEVLDTLVDTYFPMMDRLEDRIETVEEDVVAGAEPHELRQIQDTKRIVSQTRRTVFPMREAMLSLETRDHPNIGPDTRIYLRDVADHMTRLAERLDHVRELAIMAHENYNAQLQIQTNRVVKFLTAVTFMLTVPMLVGTFFGMNLPGIPQVPFWQVTLGALLFTVPVYFVARRWDWL